MANEGSESDKDFTWVLSLLGFVIAISSQIEIVRSISSGLSATSFAARSSLEVTATIRYRLKPERQVIPLRSKSGKLSDLE